jgi:hypothetical protein
VPRRTPGTDNRVLRLCRLLNAHRVRYLIAGGVAANLHGSVRATRDVDLLVPPDRANMERLLAALAELPHGIAKELEVDEVLAKPITTRPSARSSCAASRGFECLTSAFAISCAPRTPAGPRTSPTSSA